MNAFDLVAALHGILGALVEASAVSIHAMRTWTVVLVTGATDDGARASIQRPRRRGRVRRLTGRLSHGAITDRVSRLEGKLDQAFRAERRQSRQVQIVTPHGGNLFTVPATEEG
jgi:hypothetical protein